MVLRFNISEIKFNNPELSQYFAYLVNISETEKSQGKEAKNTLTNDSVFSNIIFKETNGFDF